MKTIGFIGLGRMGAPMATRLARAGHPVRAFDRDPVALAAVAEEGAEPVDSATAAAAGSDVLILMLPNSKAVDAVLLGEGVLRSLESGATAIDMGSSEPLETRRLAGEASALGIELIDAPVSGGTRGAKSGSLTIMVGGSEAGFAAVAPLLGLLGSNVRHVGAVGAAHALKALNNLLSATSLLIASEGLAIARRFGLDPEGALEVINTSSGRSGSTEVKLPDYVLPETYDSGFALALMLKDMRIAVSLGEAVGAKPKLGAEAVELWSRALDALPENADHTEIARWIESEPS
jgi:3-hydroxyisobutyrate dehydrogenase